MPESDSIPRRSVGVEAGRAGPGHRVQKPHETWQVDAADQMNLAGLGVEVKANPPRRPQDIGVVERSQGTGK